jgi:hypothetical protein
MAILCEPEFFVRWALGLSSSAKNSGWEIALNFAQLFFQEKVEKKLYAQRGCLKSHTLSCCSMAKT